MKSITKNPNNVLRGKRSRAAGKRFELKVKNDLEKMGYFVSRWMSNVEFMCSNQASCCAKLVMAKQGKFRLNSTGFPDFIVLAPLSQPIKAWKSIDRIGVEVKSDGYLTKVEREKCKWLLGNVFAKILIAKKGKIRGEIIYDERDFD